MSVFLFRVFPSLPCFVSLSFSLSMSFFQGQICMGEAFSSPTSNSFDGTIVNMPFFGVVGTWHAHGADGECKRRQGQNRGWGVESQKVLSKPFASNPPPFQVTLLKLSQRLVICSSHNERFLLVLFVWSVLKNRHFGWYLSCKVPVGNDHRNFF